MAAASTGAPATHAPIAVVWCRQVDNEAESPGYTTIPDEFPGRRETLEAIRVVGNLTVNVADTHDYWDPDPSAPLSYYPNLFLYPAAGGRYTCVGRMFLSTEDRPRIGMKTLVFETAALAASGEFGPAVLRAHATMGGRSGSDRPAAEPDQSIYQGVGEGFLYHRGSTEPVVLVTADQWEATNQVVLDLVRELPTALVALGAFLVFPYFLPVAKVDMHQFTEQLPLALAVMRVPRGEAQGERHLKRLQGWEGAPVTLRDLTRPATCRAAKDALPLVLQYARDHAEEKIGEVTRRVDLVEGTRMKAILDDVDRQAGRDRRKEMWRIGTAMETAALLLARPRGRSVSVTGEAAKRANEYVKAKPDPDRGGGGGPAPPASSASLPSPAEPAATQLPPWLQRPADITLPPEGPVAVPVSIQSDPSLLSRPPDALPPPPPPPSAPPTIPTPLPPAAPAPVDGAAIDSRVRAAFADAESKWRSTVDLRVRETADSQTRAWNESQTEVARRIEALERRPTGAPDEITRRLAVLEARPSLSPEEVSRRFAALEARPTISPDEVTREAERRVREATDPRLAGVPDLVQKAVQASGATWADSFRSELKRMTDEMNARLLRGEEELRTALVAQLDLELTEAKEQGSALREEIESRVRTLVDTRFTELEQKRIRDVRDLEQRMGLLVEGRAKDLEGRLRTQVDARATELDQKRSREAKDQDVRTGVLLDARGKDFETRMAALMDARARELESRMGNQLSISRSAIEERVSQATKRLEVEREARLAEFSDTHSKSLAGLQVRMQSYLDQKMREDSDRERGKYVELLARLKGEVDDALGRTIDSTRFDAAVRDRVKGAMEESRAAWSRSLTELEARLQTSPSRDTARLETIESQLRDREAALAQVEAKVRQDVEDLDRRVQVVTDKMLPLVRKTWVRIDEVEKLLARRNSTRPASRNFGGIWGASYVGSRPRSARDRPPSAAPRVLDDEPGEDLAQPRPPAFRIRHRVRSERGRPRLRALPPRR